MKDLKKEIYKISEILFVPNTKKPFSKEEYSLIMEDFSQTREDLLAKDEYKNCYGLGLNTIEVKPFLKILESVKELSKNINFPHMKKFIKVYYKITINLMLIKGSEWSYIRKVSYHTYRNYFNLKKFIDDNREKTVSITFKAENGETLKLQDLNINRFILATIDSNFIEINFNEVVEKMGVPTIQPNDGKFNKGFIRGLFPMFKHLKTHNPELNNTDIYVFLREFIILLGFDFETMYPNSVGDDEPFKSYFSDLK